MPEFTFSYLLTVVGATAAVVVITNAIAMATGFSKPWLGLVVAAILQGVLMAVLWTQGGLTAENAVVAAVNTFVVFLASGGANQAIWARRVRSAPDAAKAVEEQAERVFWQPWW